MAGNSDGSVIIDTELDNSGFDKGSQKLLDAVKDLTGAVDNLGDNMMRSFQTIIPVLQSIGAAVSQTHSDIASSADEVVSAEQGVTDAAKKTASSMAEQQEAIQSSTEGMASSIDNTASAMEQQNNAAESASMTFRTMRNEVVNLNKESASFATVMERLAASVRNGFTTGSSVVNFKAQLDKADAKAQEFENHLNDFANTDIPTDDYKWLTVELDKAKNALNQLIERQGKMRDLGVKENSKQWQNLSYSIEQAKAQISDY